MLLSSSDEAVLDAAENFGEALRVAQEDASQSEFESTLVDCTEEITNELGIEYGEVCGAGSDCC